VPDSATARLLIAAPDRPGLVAAITGFVAEHKGSIVDADQHTDRESGVFFQRIEFSLDGFDLDRRQLLDALLPVTEPLGMSWRLRYSDEVRRVAVLVSHLDHCLYDLLVRVATGDLPMEIAFVAGNHPDCAVAAERFGTAFHHLPVSDETRTQQERAIEVLADAAGVELVILARYMQMLTPDFVARSSRRSSAAAPTTRRTSGASRSSGSPPTTRPPIWTRARSSIRRSPRSPTVTMWPTWSASAATSRRWSWPGPSVCTSRTGSSSTAARRSSSPDPQLHLTPSSGLHPIPWIARASPTERLGPIRGLVRCRQYHFQRGQAAHDRETGIPVAGSVPGLHRHPAGGPVQRPPVGDPAGCAGQTRLS
jgi:predicted amino acid-binding ACT domain protein